MAVTDRTANGLRAAQVDIRVNKESKFIAVNDPQEQRFTVLIEAVRELKGLV